MLIKEEFTSTFVGVDAFYVDNKERWQMWLIYELYFDCEYSYGVGNDATSATFIDPMRLESSTHRSEQLVYKWCVEARIE